MILQVIIGNDFNIFVYKFLLLSTKSSKILHILIGENICDVDYINFTL